MKTSPRKTHTTKTPTRRKTGGKKVEVRDKVGKLSTTHKELKKENSELRRRSDDALRSSAETRLKHQKRRLDDLSKKDMQFLIHELGTHQIELEMQNEELRTTQTELESSRRKYFELYDLAPVGYFTLDRQGKVLNVNLTGSLMLGVGRSQLLNKPLSTFTDAKGLAVLNGHLAAVMERRMKKYACDLRMHKGDGVPFDAELQSVAASDEDGLNTLISTAIIDVTEKTHAAEALRLSEERFRLMAETSVDVIFQLDAKGAVTYLSPAASRFGYDPEKEQGADFARFILPPDIERAREALQKVLSGAAVNLLSLRMLRADGTVFEAEVSLAPVSGRNRTLGIQGICRDVTPRKLLEKALKQANEELETLNKELEAFAYAVANDLKAPLRSIEGFARAITEDYALRLDDTGRDYCRRVQSASHRMNQLIDAMYTMARTTRGELRENNVNLSMLAQNITDRLRMQEPGREVEVVVAAGLKTRGDSAMLTVALENLLENAWKFTSKHTKARIEFGTCERRNAESPAKSGQDSLRSGSSGSAKRSSQLQTVYFIKDDGAGFDQQYAGNLFQPFHRLHKDDEFPGVGIGLAIAHAIVRRHGGRMWTEAAPEKGATIFFTL